ncbi:MAG: DUF6886 family protein [Tepidiformaceae bacterium]
MTIVFHFSEEPGIERFLPRPVAVAEKRPPGREWLNGPLVWAIDSPYQAMYLFPRECPRILLWPIASTTDADRSRWFGVTDAGIIAHIEWAWFERLRTARLYRYSLLADSFTNLEDAGMWVSREAVTPVAVDVVDDLPSALGADGVELRVVPSLVPLRGVWETTLHASGIRLRNAEGWRA